MIRDRWWFTCQHNMHIKNIDIYYYTSEGNEHVSPRLGTIHLYDLRLYNFMFEKVELRVFILQRNLIKKESTTQYQYADTTLYT
jgi:hypothetical protein